MRTNYGKWVINNTICRFADSHLNSIVKENIALSHILSYGHIYTLV